MQVSGASSVTVAPLFSLPADDAQRRLTDALLPGGQDEEDDDVTVDYDEESLEDPNDEGMEIGNLEQIRTATLFLNVP